VKFISKIQNAGDVVSACTHGVLALGENDVIDLRFNSVRDAENVEVYILNLTCTKVGN
jgi:hypothetical protein